MKPVKPTVQTPANMYCPAHMQIFFRTETPIKSFITQMFFQTCVTGWAVLLFVTSQVLIRFAEFLRFFFQKNRRNKTGAFGNS